MLNDEEKNVMTKARIEVDHTGNCALCDSKNVELKKSHSIPKFVYDWLKETSKTLYIRGSDDVNSRLQDGPKEYLLCRKCEGKLSVMEREIAAKLFKKIANYRAQQNSVVVTESMRVGILSIFWRALLTTRSRDNNRTGDDDAALDSFLLSLKNQIVSERCTTKIYFTPFVGEPPYYNLPLDYVYQLERSVGGQDVRFYDKPHRFFATFKVPFVYFYIFSDGWEGSEIYKSSELVEGNIALNNIAVIPDELRAYVDYMHKQFTELKTEMSKNNLDKIKADAEKNQKITGSDISMSRMLGVDIQSKNTSKKQDS
ncbi:hypothetical protein [Acidocella sp.]|uniref:hypothetical protein n=1 Tax=Acidocella sp. TaxID=50710 RepID=UPI003D023C6E